MNCSKCGQQVNVIVPPGYTVVCSRCEKSDSFAALRREIDRVAREREAIGANYVRACGQLNESNAELRERTRERDDAIARAERAEAAATRCLRPSKEGIALVLGGVLTMGLDAEGRCDAAIDRGVDAILKMIDEAARRPRPSREELADVIREAYRSAYAAVIGPKSLLPLSVAPVTSADIREIDIRIADAVLAAIDETPNVKENADG